MHSQFDWDDFWHWRKKLREKLRLEGETSYT